LNDLFAKYRVNKNSMAGQEQKDSGSCSYTRHKKNKQKTNKSVYKHKINKEKWNTYTHSYIHELCIHTKATTMN